MIRKIFFATCLLLFSLLPFACENFEELGLTNAEVVAGLKEALKQGASYAADTILSKTGGYFKDEAVKIYLPAEVQTIFNEAKKNAWVPPLLNPIIENVEVRMNEGAEKAATKAFPIFVKAIDSMSISDAMTILKGSDNEATAYLKRTTYQSLSAAFAPEINSALNEVGAADAWNNLFSYYNNNIAPFIFQDTINSDLGKYATQKALDGLFMKVGVEETAIRNDVRKRRSELMRKVFQEQD